MRRFSALTWFQTLWPGMAQVFDKVVPGEFWSVVDLESEDADRPKRAVIACPCGAEPEVAQNSTTICDGDGCGRVFLMLGGTIRVARYDPADLAADA